MEYIREVIGEDNLYDELFQDLNVWYDTQS